MKEFEKVNEPLVDKIERAAASYRTGRLRCPNADYMVQQLREIADRIRKMHANSLE